MMVYIEQTRLDVVKLRLTRFMTIQNEGQAARAVCFETAQPPLLLLHMHNQLLCSCLT
jgi:hypothetical protein